MGINNIFMRQKKEEEKSISRVAAVVVRGSKLFKLIIAKAILRWE